MKTLLGIGNGQLGNNLIADLQAELHKVIIATLIRVPPADLISPRIMASMQQRVG